MRFFLWTERVPYTRFYDKWNLWFHLVQIESSRVEEAIPPPVTNGYPLSGGNSNRKKTKEFSSTR